MIINGNRKDKEPQVQSEHSLIDLHNVVKIYRGITGKVEALKGVDLQINQGEFVAITGRSGSGKSTLVNMITGIDHLTSGEVWVAGAPLHKMNELQTASWRGKNVGIVFQSFNLMPTLSVLQNITLPMEFAGIGNFRSRKERAMQLLEQLEIAEHANKLPSAISGGQQQRTAIARAMANDPDLLMADEPTGSLDSATSKAVFDIFEDLAIRQGKTVVYVTHDHELASRARRIVRLNDGEIIGDSVPLNMNTQPTAIPNR